MTFADIARKFQVSPKYISQIVHKKRKTRNLFLAQNIAQVTLKDYREYYIPVNLLSIARALNCTYSYVWQVANNIRKTQNIRLAQSLAKALHRDYTEFLNNKLKDKIDCQLYTLLTESKKKKYKTITQIAEEFNVSCSYIKQIMKQQRKICDIELAMAISSYTKQSYLKYLSDDIIELIKSLNSEKVKQLFKQAN